MLARYHKASHAITLVVTGNIYLAWAMNVIKLEGKVRGRQTDRQAEKVRFIEERDRKY